MAVRALIVAIEEYPQGQLSSTRLEGTNAAARSFYTWLTGPKGVLPENIYCCGGDPTLAPGCRGTRRIDIMLALRDLALAGRDQTEELYVFYSGHGAVLENTLTPSAVDMLVASDEFPPDLLGEACIDVAELKDWLRNSMGTGDHYYFIDACRNVFQAGDFVPARITLNAERSRKRAPQVRRLYSTTPGFTADVRSGFSQAVLEALEGRGRKEWSGNDLWVTFHNLCEYVQRRVEEQEVDPDPGPTPARLLRLSPVPEHECRVQVEGAGPEDRFTLTLSSGVFPPVEVTFTGAEHIFRVKPSEYFVTLKALSSALGVRRIEPPDPQSPVNLWDPGALRFELETPGQQAGPDVATDDPEDFFSVGVDGPATEARDPVILEIRAAAEAAVWLRRVSGGAAMTLGAGQHELPHGTYAIKVREHGLTLHTEEREFAPGSKVLLDYLSSTPPTVVHDALINEAWPAASGSLAAFTHALGTSSTDLGLWLSLIGAAHIIAPPGGQEILKDVLLPRFDQVVPGSSPVWILAGFAERTGPFSLALDGGREPSWEPFIPVPGVGGVSSHVFPEAGKGSHLLSFHAAGSAPLTLAVHCLPNRATLVTLTEDERGGVEVHQYVLPLGSLLNELDRTVLSRLPNEPLPVMRTMFMAQKQYARYRDIKPRAESSPEDREAWEELTYAKWLDPVMSLIAAHELMRTNDLDAGLRQSLEIIVTNMREHFPGLADVEAIAEAADLGAEPFEGFPILSDSVTVLSASEKLVDYPLPDTHRNFGTPWNSWTAAVRAP